MILFFSKIYVKQTADDSCHMNTIRVQFSFNSLAFFTKVNKSISQQQVGCLHLLLSSRFSASDSVSRQLLVGILRTLHTVSPSWFWVKKIYFLQIIEYFSNLGLAVRWKSKQKFHNAPPPCRFLLRKNWTNRRIWFWNLFLRYKLECFWIHIYFVLFI